MASLSDHIRSSGQSQREWAARFGVSEPYLSDLLRGNRRPSLDLACRIERATGGAVPALSWVPAAPTEKGAA
ncbi:MAG: helix-turn-helix transcriptional regulator [Rhodobacteraceae bacterium]|nr:helix-turn-helix transcriptional regulator [Paracoccaceae bacterium]